ncbi:MAG: threonine ammonia-lyase [Planctomycetes bacterium]|nr:threonine ammonia-lyase [Planctomycetota bacterium]
MPDLASIRAAADRIRGAVVRTPCPHSQPLSLLTGAQVWCKFEHLQATGSFKERGARNRLMQLDAGQREAGVIAASAGNHALGLAWHGRALGIPVTVVMPRHAPVIKVANCRKLGATVVQHGESFDDARAHATQLSQRDKLTYVHGFDDDQIMAGAGTIGLELIEDIPDLDVVIVPVGGGGLIAGIGAAIKALRPSVRVIGGESRAAPTLAESMRVGSVQRIVPAPTLADGLAIAEVGPKCFAICQRVVDAVELVDEPEIATALLRLMELEKTLVEGAAAVTLAVALRLKEQLAGKRVALVLAGGNIDLTMVGHVIEHGLAADGRLCRIVAHMSDRPGSLARLLGVIAGAGGSIKDVHHDRAFGPFDPARVTIACVIESRDHDHVREIKAALAAAGIEAG